MGYIRTAVSRPIAVLMMTIAVALFGLDSYAAAVLLDYCLAYGQAEAGAALGA